MISYFLTLILIHDVSMMDIDSGNVDLPNNVLKFGYGINYTGDSSFKFFNRSLPFFAKEQVIVKPKEGKFIKIEAPL